MAKQVSIYNHCSSEQGFSLIELLIVLVILSIVWLVSIPLLTPNPQRQAQDWLYQAQALLELSCDLSAQTLQPHRVTWTGSQLQLEGWQQQQWQITADVMVLSALDIPAWKVKVQTDPLSTSGLQASWLCRDIGEQTAGRIQLIDNETSKNQLILKWQGDGRYEFGH